MRELPSSREGGRLQQHDRRAASDVGGQAVHCQADRRGGDGISTPAHILIVIADDQTRVRAGYSSLLDVAAQRPAGTNILNPSRAENHTAQPTPP
jgi:hypothetical protein